MHSGVKSDQVHLAHTGRGSVRDRNPTPAGRPNRTLSM